MLPSAAAVVVAATVVLIAGVVPLAGIVPIAGVVLAAVLVGAVLLVLEGFLVANGLRILRPDGRGLGHVVSMAAAVVIPGAVLAEILLLSAHATAAIVVALLVGVASYVGAVFCGFLVMALRRGRAELPRRADVVVVLGAGLRDGQVPPLLQTRLDRAVEVYRRSEAAGTTPLMIPSGGQGDDESRAEGDAMAEYLVAQGIPPARVRPETRSTNTRENLLLSRRVQHEAEVAGDVVVVTNEYHVLRSAMLARELGIGARVVGARTTRRSVPSAFLRELLALIYAHRRIHAAALVVLLALWGTVLVVTVRA